MGNKISLEQNILETKKHKRRRHTNMVNVLYGQNNYQRIFEQRRHVI